MPLGKIGNDDDDYGILVFYLFRYYGSGMNIPELLEGKRILDIGCGSGSLVFLLGKLVGPTGYVIGVDLTDGLVSFQVHSIALTL